MRNSIAPHFKELGWILGEKCRGRGEEKYVDKVNCRVNLG